MVHSLDDLSKLSQRERRRLIFLRSASKYRDLGMPIDDDARFTELIERWIDGEIEMKDVAAGARGTGPVLRTLASVLPHIAEPPEGATQTLDGTLVENDASGMPSGGRNEPMQRYDDLLMAIDEMDSNTGSPDRNDL